MSVVIETTIGDITVDLFVQRRPRTCQNFLKLCKLKYYNFNLFHSIQHDFLAQTGDPTGSGHSGSSVWGVVEGPEKRFFEAETTPKIRHSDVKLISMVSSGEKRMIGSQFFLTLGPDLLSLDDSHCVFGEVVEGVDVLRKLNETIVDEKFRPYKDVRITHTVVLDDPFDDPRGFRAPSRSPSPSAERLQGGRIAADEEINDKAGKTEAELNEMIQAQEAKAQATILEIVGDLPDADMAPPENVLFVCKLNPVTSDDDLEIIFSRFGRVKACEVIRDKKSGDSLQYAFVEFEEQKSCEDAYLKMDNVLIDDRRIHVDFSQSVSKLKWQGKGRGVIDMDDQPRGGRGGRGGGGGPRINFNDKNWKNGQRREFQGNNRRRSRSRSRSPVRRGDQDRRRERETRNEGRRRSRERSPRKVERSRDNDDRRVRRDDDGDRRRRNDDYERRERGAGGRERNRSRNRSRSRSPRGRRLSPVPSSRRRSPDRYHSNDRRSRSPVNRRRENERREPESRHRTSQSTVEREENKRRDRSVDRKKKRKSSASEDSESSSDSSEDEKRRKKKEAKKAKQKRNKTKKSRESRSTSEDDSSSTNSDESQEDKRRRKKHSKKNKKKHKKVK